MRVFIAGATGAIGRRLVPALVDAGHQVTGTTRSTAKADQVRRAGADPVVVEPLDRDAVVAAVTASKPDVVIHQLTALGEVKSFKRVDQEFVTTNLLRTKGVDYLLDAALAAGARRFIAQSFTGWTNPRTGGPVKTEADPLDPAPVPAARETLAAIRHMETRVTGAAGIEGVVLRYGLFYGPGTGLAQDGDMVELIRKRQLPIVGGGAGISSFIHIDDATTATVAAVQRGAPGLYNITDDEPAPAAEWVPHLAAAVGGPPPRRVPAWLVRPIVGQYVINMMTANRGSSNAKAKRELGWTLTYPSWRQGFQTGLG